VVAVVSALVNDREVAAEVTDEAFARALARWDRVRAMEQPSAWVYRVAVNLAKRRAVRLRTEERLLMRRPTPFVEPGHQAAEVWEAVGALPPRQRMAVVLRYVNDLSEADVAAVMGIAPGTAAATLNAARQRLGRMWGDT
jgi:RNA polymerase sigma factor (sigma-70 family)